METGVDDTRVAWAFWPVKGGGWAWQRMILPVGIVERYASGPKQEPDTKGITMAKIENEMASDRVVTRRDW